MRPPRTLVTATLVLATGCTVTTGSGTYVAKSEVEHHVATRLAASVGQKPTSVTCPGKLKAETRTRMRCRLEAPDGTTYGLTVTVTSVTNGTTNFHIQVDDKRSLSSAGARRVPAIRARVHQGIADADYVITVKVLQQLIGNTGGTLG